MFGAIVIYDGATQQIIEREAGTATLLSNLRGELSTGLAACSRPRYLRRSPQYRCNVSRTFCI